MRIRVAHVSLQFSDSDRQHTHDIKKIFQRAENRNIAWITGTEAGPGAGNTASELVRIGRAAGYRMWVPASKKSGPERFTDCWIAVRSDLVKSGWKTDYREAIKGSSHFYREQGLKNPSSIKPKWGPKGLVAVQFNSLPQIGQVNIGAAHYLTGANNPKTAVIKGVDHWEQNKILAGVIGGWAREVGKGSALAFYAGDQNMNDQANHQPQGDSFMGHPMTSLADELKKWYGTGHGPIDVIASYNGDGRVSGVNFTVLNDRKFFLHTDHFFLEGIYNIRPLEKR